LANVLNSVVEPGYQVEKPFFDKFSKYFFKKIKWMMGGNGPPKADCQYPKDKKISKKMSLPIFSFST